MPAAIRPADGAPACCVMAPGNVTPATRTPWGGTRIAERWPAQAVPGMALPQVIGESWIVSTHPSFPSTTSFHIDGAERLVPLRTVCGELPFLIKLLNSASWTPLLAQLQSLVAQLPGARIDLSANYHAIHRSLVALLAASWPEALQPVVQSIRAMHQQMLAANLSIQVHPPHGYAPDKPSKTEAWIILEAEPGAGIYLGLRDGVTREQFESAACAKNFAEGDISELLNFVPVRAGDIFFIPSGTIHAIGAGIVLLEPQEASETTFRVFDWYRHPTRELHVADTLAVTQWDAPRGAAAVAHCRRTPQREAATGAELLIDAPEFQVRRWTLVAGDAVRWPHAVPTAYVALDGVVTLTTDHGTCAILRAGQACVVTGQAGLTIVGQGVCYCCTSC